MRKAKYRGRLVTLPNPSEPCPQARKPVGQITDRAKRYRANQPACKPGGSKKCIYCGRRKNVEVHHLDGNEDNGKRTNLAWACRPCNTAIGAEFKKAGLGKRTRQYNPRKRRGRGDPAFTQFAWAVNVICRRRDEARGLCSRSSDPLTKQAVEIIRSTPLDVRRAYARRARSMRRGSEVPF
jgi:hypothetical protein